MDHSFIGRSDRPPSGEDLQAKKPPPFEGQERNFESAKARLLQLMDEGTRTVDEAVKRIRQFDEGERAALRGRADEAYSVLQDSYIEL